MKSLSFSMVIILSIISCSRLPGLVTVDPAIIPEIQQKCSSPFIIKKWQFIHHIEVAMPDGKKGSMIGIIVISPRVKTIQCVIMTIEGFVVFDALYDKNIVIHRSLHPFDSINFSKGLMNDLKLIFFKPNGQFLGLGMSENGKHFCRYRNNNGMTTDICTSQNGKWTIRQYNRNSQLSRTVKASMGSHQFLANQTMIPTRLELTAYGRAGYRLVIDLIEAKPLDGWKQ